MSDRIIRVSAIEHAFNFGYELHLKLRALQQGICMYVTIDTDVQRWLHEFVMATSCKPGAYQLCCLFCKGAVKNEFHWIVIDYTGFYSNIRAAIMSQYAGGRKIIANAILIRDLFVFESDDDFMPVDWFHIHIVRLNEVPKTRTGWVDLILRQHEWDESCLYLKERSDIRLSLVKRNGTFQVLNCGRFYDEL